MYLFILIKLIVKIKSINDSRQMNRLIPNKLIEDLFNYLSYLYLTF